MTGAGMQTATRELLDHETLAAVFRSAKIEPWQTDLDAASLAACEDEIHPDDRARRPEDVTMRSKRRAAVLDEARPSR